MLPLRLLLVLIGLLAALLLPEAVSALPNPQPTPVQVSHDRWLAHSEPMLAEDPTDPNHLVGASKLFSDIHRYLFTIGTYLSRDGGKTWIDNGPLPGYGAYRRVSDVSIAFSPDARLVYACLLATKGRRSGIFVNRSRDAGRTWDAPNTVYLDTTGATFNDKPWITVDETAGPHRGTLDVAWNLDTTNHKGAPKARHPGIAVARSTDEGRSFTAPTIVYPFRQRHFALGAIPVVSPNGSVHVAFLEILGSGKSTHYAMGLAASADAGAHFSPARTVISPVRALPNHLPHGTFRNFSMPAFAVSPKTGTLLLAWGDIRRGDADVYKSASRDGGRTWSVPARVNDDLPQGGKDQFQPALAAASDGSFAVSWFDRRFDPGNRLIDTVVALSTNDGRTFGRNIRVTPRSWNPAIDAPTPGGKAHDTFIGDYQGLTADAQTVRPFWNDTANGRSQEIRSSTIPRASLETP